MIEKYVNECSYYRAFKYLRDIISLRKFAFYNYIYSIISTCNNIAQLLTI